MTDPQHHEQATGKKSEPNRRGFDMDEPLGADSARSEEPALPIANVVEAASDNRERDAEIRQRAYELYLSRGASDGNDMADWLQAEEDVRRRG